MYRYLSIYLSICIYIFIALCTFIPVSDVPLDRMYYLVVFFFLQLRMVACDPNTFEMDFIALAVAVADHSFRVLQPFFYSAAPPSFRDVLFFCWYPSVVRVTCVLLKISYNSHHVIFLSAVAHGRVRS